MGKVASHEIYKDDNIDQAGLNDINIRTHVPRMEMSLKKWDQPCFLVPKTHTHTHSVYLL